MEKDGLVVRRRHPADRRSTLIGMTEAARALFARMAPAHARWIERAMAGLDREEVGLLWAALGDLKASVRGSMQDVGPAFGIADRRLAARSDPGAAAGENGREDPAEDPGEGAPE